MPLAPLPIDDVLPQLIAGLRQNRSIVLRAPPGAGKTTRVPPALLDAGLASPASLPKGQIIVLQPRRLAARATAARMAAERGGVLGEEIGYQVRFERKSSSRTRILVVTEGILLRMLQDDPMLAGVSLVIFDEFHERSINSDLALGMVRQVQQELRDDLRIVVMSATLEAAPIAKYLHDCPSVESLGRLFPVAVQYLDQTFERNLARRATTGVDWILSKTTGDVLVFLPGIGEIRQTAELLADRAAVEGLLVLPLHGDLPLEQQAAALTPAKQRKIILATNVAETSITVEGVTGVVDLGVARQNIFDENAGLDRLELLPISKSSAEQRAGRAGRTQPGVCVRLWSEASQRQRPEATEPEIRRVDLAATILQLAAWIEPDADRFPWFDPPRSAALEQARILLRRLDATGERGLTELGKQMAALPVHPRLARLLLESQRRGVLEQAAMAAALLSERDPFRMARTAEGRPRSAAHRSRSDLLDKLDAIEEVRTRSSSASSFGISSGAVRQLVRVQEQLLRQVPTAKDKSDNVCHWQATSASASSASDPDEAFSRALIAAFPDRVARRREPGSRQGVMVGGRGVKLATESAVSEAELFLCLDVDGAGSEGLVRMASGIERGWLPETHVDARVEVVFDDATGKVIARRRTYFEDLLLDERNAPLPGDDEAARLLAEAALGRIDSVLPKDDEAWANYLERVKSLREWLPDLELPSIDEALFARLLPNLCYGRRSLEDLRRAPWLSALQGELTHRQRQQIEREAPERIEVPSGSQIRLQYEAGRPPVLAVRIQEVFGLLDTPRVARGRVSVLMHLLAPNMRPEQVTSDLRSFWKNTYPQVRKDLRGRYPKHSWPDDPLTAPPQKKPQRRRP